MTTKPTSSVSRTLLDHAQDPEWWIKHVLGAELWSAQTEICRAVVEHEEVVVASCHGAGKSFTSARIALWFLFCHENSLVITTAPTARQVGEILWREIATAYNGARVKLGGRLLTQQLDVGDQWFAIGFTAPQYDPNRWQGLHAPHILVILDEACGISKSIMESIDGVLTSAHSRKLSIGNPTDPLSPFAADFKRADVHKMHISAFDTPNFTAFGITLDDITAGTWQQKITGPLPRPELVTPQWVARRARKWGVDSALFVSKVLGRFPSATIDTLIPLPLVDAAVAREIDLTITTPVYLSVDVARFGDDETVFAMRRGDHARIMETRTKDDTMATVGRVRHWLDEYPEIEEVRIDECGVGGGVLDRLLELGVNVVPVIAGAGADDSERYLNVRCEMYGQLAARYKDGTITHEEDEDLAAQVTAHKIKGYKSTGQMILLSKEEMKGGGMASPDRADALAMLFYEPGDRGRARGGAVSADVPMPRYSY